MSGRDKNSVRRLPFRLLLVLFLCTCSLAVHFAAEGFAPAGSQFGFDLAVQGGNSDSVHEHGEDHFVLSSLNTLQGISTLTWLISQAPTRSLSHTVSPLLPPPN